VFEKKHGNQFDNALLLELRKFLVNNAVFSPTEYHGIERMLMIEDVFQPVTVRVKHGDHDKDEVIGVPHQSHLQLFRDVINEEYGLSNPVPDSDQNYTLADYLWHVYHNENQNGQKPGHEYMARVVMKLFQQSFDGTNLSVTRREFRGLDYLNLEWGNGWKWPITFRGGARILNDDNFPYRISKSFSSRGGWDIQKEFPTVCGSYFADDMSEAAKDCDVQLIQLSSILKLIQWINLKQSEGHPAITLLEVLHLLLRVNQEDRMVPLAVGLGIRAMEEKLPKLKR